MVVEELRRRMRRRFGGREFGGKDVRSLLVGFGVLAATVGF